MLTINSTIGDLYDLDKLVTELENELYYFYCSWNIGYIDKHNLEKVKTIMSLCKMDELIEPEDEKNIYEGKKIAIIRINFKEYPNSSHGKHICLTLYINADKCKMSVTYYENGVSGPSNVYQKYMDIINEKFKRFLN